MTRLLDGRLDALECRAAIVATCRLRVICTTEADAARAASKPGEGLLMRMIFSPGGADGRT